MFDELNMKKEFSGQVASWVGGEVLAVIRHFLGSSQFGWVFPADCRYQCDPESPGNLLRPDVSFILKAKLLHGQFFDGHIPVAPDLVVEVNSPRDYFDSLETKIAEYQAAGVSSI